MRDEIRIEHSYPDALPFLLQHGADALVVLHDLLANKRVFGLEVPVDHRSLETLLLVVNPGPVIGDQVLEVHWEERRCALGGRDEPTVVDHWRLGHRP